MEKYIKREGSVIIEISTWSTKKSWADEEKCMANVKEEVTDIEITFSDPHHELPMQRIKLNERHLKFIFDKFKEIEALPERVEFYD